MNYVMNDFSLRGQFKDMESFLDSIRNNIKPILRKIEAEEDGTIWKKDTFWQLEVCNGITLQDFSRRMAEIMPNTRRAELPYLKQKLMKLYAQTPYWSEEEDPQVLAVRYDFDPEMRNEFLTMNCFIKAYHLNGRMISFEHEEYPNGTLVFWIEQDGREVRCELENMRDATWWDEETSIRKWPRIAGLYRVEVRAHEVDRHCPHFHVTYNEYSASFAIENGEVLQMGKEEMPSGMRSTIQRWYVDHAEELKAAWDLLHKSIGDK